MSAGAVVLGPPLVDLHLEKPIALGELERLVARFCPLTA